MEDKLIDDAVSVDSDKYDEMLGGDDQQPDNSSILTEIEQEKEQSDNYKEIERRAQINDFIIEWAKNPDEHFSGVAVRMGMHIQKATDFAREFMSVMKQAAEQGRYPIAITEYFNDKMIPINRRITFQMINDLAPTIENHLNSIEKPNYTEPVNNVVSDQQQSTVPIPPNPPGFQQIPKILDPDDLGDENLTQNNHTITQLIYFGLKKFAIEPAQQRRYIMDIIRTNKLFYSTNRNALRDLLSSVIKHQPTVNSFLDWLENVAPLYLLPGEPFYRMMSPNNMMDPNNPNAMNNNMPPALQQLLGGLPPAQAQMVMQNLFTNNKASEQQRQAEEDAQLDRYIARMSKVMTISMLKNAMDPNQQRQGGGMDMSQQYMMQGYRPSEVIQPDGTRRIEWLPPYAPQGGGQANPFQSVESVIGLVKAIFDISGTAAKGSDLNETLTKIMMEKLMTDPFEQLVKIRNASEQLGLTKQGSNGVSEAEALKLRLEMNKLENEKTFGLKQLEIQERQMQREEAREAAHEQQSNENIAMLMKFVPGVINNMAMPVIQKFFGGGNKAEAVQPQPQMGPPQEDFNGMMFAPQPERGGFFNKNKKLLQQGGVPLGGIMNDSDNYIDPQNGQVTNGLQQQEELQRQADINQRIENEVMHRIHMAHLRNNMAPPVQQEQEPEQFTKEYLMTLSNEQLSAIGQTINNQREKYESSIKDFNEVVMMRQQQARQQGAVITEDQYQDAFQSEQQQEHPPVISQEEYSKRFNMPEDVDLNSDGVDSISEEDYEASSQQGQGDAQVVDFSSDSEVESQGSDSLLSDENDLSE